MKKRHTTKTKLRIGAALAAALVLAAGCGSDAGDGDDSGDAPEGAASFEQPFSDVAAYPVLVNSEITVGENRMLMGVLDDNDAPVGSPDVELHVSYFDLEESAEESVAADAPEFVWSVEDLFGVYVGSATFDHAGKWGMEVHIAGDGLDETVRTSFEVREEGTTPALGEKVPASDTPTSDDVANLKRISTDPDPQERFYEYSIAGALKQKDSFVVTFATPKFCQTAVCGPTLDIVKDVAADFPKVNFVHVEPYELPAEPPNFEVVPSVEEWGLPSEPWVFVVNADGTLASKFEGIVGAEELRAALESL